VIAKAFLAEFVAATIRHARQRKSLTKETAEATG